MEGRREGRERGEIGDIYICIDRERGRESERERERHR